jgi:hypothetical protein
MEHIETSAARGRVLHVRVDDREMQIITNLAKGVYGFRSTGEFLRYVIAHVDKTRPTLGKDFAPGHAG